MLKLLIIAALIVPAAAVAAPEKGKRERLICKREVATGSLARPKRTCLTRDQWEQSRRLNRENVEQWQNKMNAEKSG